MKREDFDLDELNARFEGADAQAIVDYFVERYAGAITLASSLSIEDQVLTDMVRRVDASGKRCSIFTLDTGRLFAQTYSLIERTAEHYGVRIDVMFPNTQLVERMVAEEGVNLFYRSVELRRRCCHVRKIEPLRRAFEGCDVWICGLRHSQSVTRSAMRPVEWDEGNGMLKINPLIEWSERQTWDYIHKHGIPYNALHDEGFPSIGCQPCTRAVKEGEDIRGGRWWWENADQKECGLHR